jgi:hypothetical protein
MNLPLILLIEHIFSRQTDRSLLVFLSAQAQFSCG